MSVEECCEVSLKQQWWVQTRVAVTDSDNDRNSKAVTACKKAKSKSMLLFVEELVRT